jgi:hypothetical protein
MIPMAEKEIALLKEQIDRLDEKSSIWKPGKTGLKFSWNVFSGKKVPN